MMEAGELLLDLPGVGHEAPAILLIDPSPEADTAGLAELVTVAGRRPSKARRSARARVLKGAALAFALAGLVWLALPAPLIVTASALSQPAQARAVTLPFDAYLREMRVEVGEAVDAGEVWRSSARLRSRNRRPRRGCSWRWRPPPPDRAGRQ